jgi:hypothetical protein
LSLLVSLRFAWLSVVLLGSSLRISAGLAVFCMIWGWSQSIYWFSEGTPTYCFAEKQPALTTVPEVREQHAFPEK